MSKLTDEQLLELFSVAQSFPHTDDGWDEIDHDSSLTSIRYKDRPYFSLKSNLRHAFEWAVWPLLAREWEKQLVGRKIPFTQRLAHIWIALRWTDKNLPDATLYGGSIITYWQEHAYYIASMRPTVVKEAFEELLIARGLPVPPHPWQKDESSQ